PRGPRDLPTGWWTSPLGTSRPSDGVVDLPPGTPRSLDVPHRPRPRRRGGVTRPRHPAPVRPELRDAAVGIAADAGVLQGGDVPHPPTRGSPNVRTTGQPEATRYSVKNP